MLIEALLGTYLLSHDLFESVIQMNMITHRSRLAIFDLKKVIRFVNHSTASVLSHMHKSLNHPFLIWLFYLLFSLTSLHLNSHYKDYGWTCTFIVDNLILCKATAEMTDICYQFEKSGTCRFGNECKFSHIFTNADSHLRFLLKLK